MTEKTHASLAIPPRETDGGHEMPPRNRSWRRARIAMWIVLALLAIGALRTVIANMLQSRAVAESTTGNARQYVNVVMPTETHGGAGALLPGTLRGFVESPIYARATGYLLHRYVDIGSRVKQGELLADLDTPEIDQELAQAVAQREQISASLGLAKSSLARWQQLRQRDAVSQQELDERQGTFNQGVANLAAADANVKRLRQLESFKRIVAPFAGVVTQRNVGVGDLIDAGSGSARSLFALAQSDPLRVYIQLPQAYAGNVATGQKVVVTQAELPGQAFQGTISHLSGAIDVPTRSLQVEITLPNPEDKLRPGAYVQVALPSSTESRLMVPDNALLFRKEGPRLGVVDADGMVKLHPIVIARDLGEQLEIESGIGPGDRVIVNPSDSLADGDQVQVAPPLKGKGMEKSKDRSKGKDNGAGEGKEKQAAKDGGKEAA
jgi:RND family efflux transporter MFP subunit